MEKPPWMRANRQTTAGAFILFYHSTFPLQYYYTKFQGKNKQKKTTGSREFSVALKGGVKRGMKTETR